MRIVSFNLQRLRLRHVNGQDRLDGARDGDSPLDSDGADPALDLMDRKLTAQVLAELNADVAVLQEVFDQETLDHFHDHFLLPSGAQPWPHRLCLPGNDGHGLDVAVMSRRPLQDVRSHAEVTCADLVLQPYPPHGPDERIFRRDCLRVQIGPLWLYACHFKAPYPDPERSWTLRRREAEAVRMLVERDMAGKADPLWLILGDLNEPSGQLQNGEKAIAPITDPAFSIDLVSRIDARDRWSFHEPDSGEYSRPDAMLASPAFAARYPKAVPFFMRAGMERDAARYHGRHLPGVGQHRPHASDHAALAIDLPNL